MVKKKTKNKKLNNQAVIDKTKKKAKAENIREFRPYTSQLSSPNNVCTLGRLHFSE